MLHEIPHTEDVQNIQKIAVYVQEDCSTFSFTISWFCQLAKIKKKFTAELPAPFVPSSGACYGAVGLGGRGVCFIWILVWVVFFPKRNRLCLKG